MRKSNLVAALITGAVLVTGGLLSAQAASAANNCTANQGCLYGYDNYTALLAFKSGGSSLSNLTTASTANETASWGNDSNYWGCLYDNIGGTGASWVITPRSSQALSWVDRDRAESWKLDGTGC